jgi:hypothetical protein
MKLPATRQQIKDAGYVFAYARACRRCNAHLEFYRTPSKSVSPLETVMINDVWLMDSHFKTCPFADEFHKKSASAPAPKKPDQGDLFGGKK